MPPETLTPADRVDFVNREIDRQLDLWKYTHDRMLGPLAPILGLSAAFIPAAAVLLSETVRDERRFYLASTPFLLFMSTFGVLVAARMTRATLHHEIYFMRADVLRSYFAGRSRELAGCLPPRRVSYHDVEVTLQDLADRLVAWPPVVAALGISSGLNGVIAGVLVWWAVEDAPSWSLALIGVLTVAVSLRAGLAYVAWARRTTAEAIAQSMGLAIPQPSQRRWLP